MLKEKEKKRLTELLVENERIPTNKETGWVDIVQILYYTHNMVFEQRLSVSYWAAVHKIRNGFVYFTVWRFFIISVDLYFEKIK